MAAKRKRQRGARQKMPSAEELVKAVTDWTRLVAAGADPIEAMHGHVCSPECWHYPHSPYSRGQAR